MTNINNIPRIIRALIEGDLNQVEAQVDVSNQNDENVLATEQQLKNQNDPVKDYIDKLVDTKNKIFTSISNNEIEKVVNQSKPS